MSMNSLLAAPVLVWAALLVPTLGVATPKAIAVESNIDAQPAPSSDRAIATHSTLQIPTQSNSTLAIAVDKQSTGSSVQPVVVSAEKHSVVQQPVITADASAVASTAASDADSSPGGMDTVAGVADLGKTTAALSDSVPNSGMEQVTSVSQLKDVQPSDWAFQALQSLVERYGCIVGYPDQTFRGNRALSRYEFAAGLNACMDRINELIAAGTADLVKKEDLATLQKLQEQFAAELATLRGRVDALEARTAKLEAQQFSTTTKLNGLVWFNLTGASSGGDDVTFEANEASVTGPVPGGVRTAGRTLGRPNQQKTNNAEITFSGLAWLTFNTSFTGKDSLVTQIAAGNGISPANQFVSAGFFNAQGVPFTDQSGGTANGSMAAVIHDLFYSFPVGDKVRVTVGPRVNWYRHFDFNRFTFFLNGAGSFNSIGSTQTNAIDRGSGAVVEFNISKKLRFAAAYLGENTEFLSGLPFPGYNTSSDPNFGLFGGTNTTTAELTFSPTDKLNLRFMYNYSRLQAVGGQVGGATGEPIPYGQVDDGFSGGGLKYAYAHTLAFNFDWLLTKNIGIFGRYSFGNTNLKPISKAVDVQSFQIGLGFPDLGKKGALAVVTFLMPMDIIRGGRYFAAGNGDGGTEYNLEASYYYPVNDNIAIVPSFYTIFNINNFDSNPNVYIGNVRMQFSF